MKIGINGFGRIGKCVARAFLERGDSELQLAVINSNKLTPAAAAHMLKYDSAHGVLSNNISHDESLIIYNNSQINISSITGIEEMNWDNVDVVLECTGAFNSKQQAYQHINYGAKTVIVSAPCKDADATIILGVHEIPNDVIGKVLSVGSCTTNCLAPVIKPLHDAFSITSAFMTTVHSYTNDQCLVDSRHTDLRRRRAANISIIPTSTGAAKMIGQVIPELDDKIDGVGVRVPTQNVSMIDLKFTTNKKTSVEEINNLMVNEAMRIPGILGVTNEELVSIDFNHTSQSAIFDLTQTKAVGGQMYRVVAWYDNEWAFANRMIDLCKTIALRK